MPSGGSVRSRLYFFRKIEVLLSQGKSPQDIAAELRNG